MWNCQVGNVGVSETHANMENTLFLSILGYIDLSKRRVSATDIVKCEERYNKSKAVHSIMSTVAKKENKDMEALYEELAWPLYHKYGHAYDAFKVALKYVYSIDRNGAQNADWKWLSTLFHHRI